MKQLPFACLEKAAAYITGMSILRLTIVLGCAAIIAGSANAAPLKVFAAASTREALIAATRAFTDRTGIPVVCEFDASSALARKIEQGAEADLFLSADEASAEFLAKLGLVASRRDLLGNCLVIIVPASSKRKLNDLADIVLGNGERLAVAAEAVPAGLYARQALQTAGAWDGVKDRLVEGRNVRATLLYVERGEAEFGIVYATDARGDDKVRVAYNVPTELHAPIRYPLVVLRTEPGGEVGNQAVHQLAEFLAGSEAKEIFRKAGFEILTDNVAVKSTARVFLAGDDWAALGYSAIVSSVAVVLSLPFGIALGWMLARHSFRGKAVVETFLNLPLVMPPVVTGYVLLLLFGRRGVLGGWLHHYLGIDIAFTAGAAMLAAAVMGFPLMVRAIRLAFQGTDSRLYQAARSLGARPLDAFFSVSLPLARNGVIAGSVLSFARGLGEFGATLLFAGSAPGRRTLAVQIFDLYEQPGRLYEERMWRLVLASILLACAALAISEYLERRGARRESA